MHYQKCFGGILHLETFDEQLEGYPEKPVIIGSLISESIIIHGTDLVQDEGRKIGNYLSVFLSCKDAEYRNTLITKLKPATRGPNEINEENQQLIEVTDAFDVRWVLGV